MMSYAKRYAPQYHPTKNPVANSTTVPALRLGFSHREACLSSNPRMPYTYPPWDHQQSFRRNSLP